MSEIYHCYNQRESLHKNDFDKKEANKYFFSQNADKIRQNTECIRKKGIFRAKIDDVGIP